MSAPTQRSVIQVLLEAHGTTYADEAGIDVEANTPGPLFRLVCMSLLLSARIRAAVAISATKALGDAGWCTAERLAASSWRERTDVLNHAGYARYDERTARMLGDTAELVLERWHGDLRELRDEAGREPSRERSLVQECSGIGPVGADIFCREAQVAWEELAPFADVRARGVAAQLGLPEEPTALRRLVVDTATFVQLVDALVRVGLAGRATEVVDLASRR